jgi:hypothetical protein
MSAEETEDVRSVLAELRPAFRILLIAVPAAAFMIAVAAPPSSSASARELPIQSQTTIGLGTAAPRDGDAGQLAPGETLQRLFDLSLAPRPGAPVGLVIRALANRSSLLDADARTGLRVGIDRCLSPRGWRPGPGGAYTCAGSVKRALPPLPVAQAKDRMFTLADVVPGPGTHLRMTFSLPASAGNRLQRLNSSLRFTFSVQV